MNTIIYLNDKKISRAAAEAQFGKDRISRYIAEAKEGFMRDPYEQQSWYVGGGNTLCIEFK